MTEIVNNYNTFWLLIFIFLIIVVIVIGLVIRGNNSDKKDTDIFFKSSDNAKDITLDINEKASKNHSELIDGIPIQYQKELHYLELSVEDNKNKMNKIIQIVQDINKKLDLTIERIVELEKQK